MVHLYTNAFKKNAFHFSKAFTCYINDYLHALYMLANIDIG